MSDLSMFLKANKIKKENFKFAPTKSLRDKDGNPLEFEFRHLTSSQDRLIRESCTLGGRFNSSLYTRRMLAACVVYPDLLNAQLQDSYGAYTPEDLLEELIDDATEYMNFSIKMQKELGFESLGEAVEEAKN